MSTGKQRSGAAQAAGCWIRPEKRLAIYLRDSFRCIYCCADLHAATPQDITLDHVIARADGGGNGEGNLVTACRHCNCARQDTPLSRWTSREVRADVKRLTRRGLRRYLVLAKALIAGETGDAAIIGTR